MRSGGFIILGYHRLRRCQQAEEGGFSNRRKVYFSTRSVVKVLGYKIRAVGLWFPEAPRSFNPPVGHFFSVLKLPGVFNLPVGSSERRKKDGDGCKVVRPLGVDPGPGDTRDRLDKGLSRRVEGGGIRKKKRGAVIPPLFLFLFDAPALSARSYMNGLAKRSINAMTSA